ncbi:MAG: HAMP domain-containing protein [Desulfobulbaceae bacterium]|nr:HAMP domain-containing protein [Desulfobulbaceae bacterium]
MQFRTLKAAIFLQLFCLLVLAMSLLALAAGGLWHHRAARQEHDWLARLARLQASALASDQDGRLRQLRALCDAAGAVCRRAALLDEASRALAEVGPRQSGSTEKSGRDSALKVFPFQAERVIQIDEAAPGGHFRLRLTVALSSPSVFSRPDLSLIVSFIVVNALVFAAIGFFRLAKKIIRPLERLTATADRYADELDRLFHRQSGDELSRLSQALRGLFLRIERDNERLKETVAHLERAKRKLQTSQKEIIRAEKLASIGRLAAGLAHEIGNPLGIVQGYVSLLCQNDLDLDERADFARRAESELRRVSGLIRNLLDFARRPAPDANDQANLSECIDKLLAILRAHKDAKHIELAVVGAIPEARLSLSADALYQALLNCLFNAIDAVKSHGREAGRIRLCCQLDDDASPRRLVITVADDGGGIEEQHLDSLFDPFFTTKEPGKGVGLGLAVSHSLIEAAGGAMRLENNDEGGATATIVLPLAADREQG